MKNPEKELSLVCLIGYKSLDSRYYKKRTLKDGTPALYCPFYYCKRTQQNEKVPYFCYVFASDEQFKYHIGFYRDQYGMILAMRNVSIDFVQCYVDDLYGAAQRCSIKEYDGRNYPTTLKQEVSRIKMWEDDKFKFAEKIEYRQDVIDKIMKEEY